MMKFMCICLCAIAAVSANSYGSARGGYGGAPVGAYAYQVQPALTVKAIVPAYGGGYGGQQGGYGGEERGYGGGYEAAPLASAYSGANAGSGYSGSGYGGAPPVDRQAIALAKLALAAPSAGGPVLWKEAPRYVEPVYPPISYGPQEYGRAEKVKGGSAAAAASSVAAGKKGYKRPSY
ncbi:chorion protein S18 [Drosophila rhopaloa]|uniref:Chorion protein S18 n=1 Tax=Drosophila rhopaloa TaxID=1041015 RepID=A0A6P4EF27_DRORH|nr:chorion protein S18 [Drosophila rhopaloa]